MVNFLRENRGMMLEKQERLAKSKVKKKKIITDSQKTSVKRIKKQAKTDVADSTVLRFLKNNDFKYGSTIKTPSLTPIQKQQRVLFCQRRRNDNLQSSIFVDETSIFTHIAPKKTWYSKLTGPKDLAHLLILKNGIFGEAYQCQELLEQKYLTTIQHHKNINIFYQKSYYHGKKAKKENEIQSIPGQRPKIQGEMCRKMAENEQNQLDQGLSILLPRPQSN
ncbi:hypothetical protein ABPG72_013997 [Tetrahymena utriculariae]